MITGLYSMIITGGEMTNTKKIKNKKRYEIIYKRSTRFQSR